MEAQVTSVFVDLVLAMTTVVGGFIVAEIRKRVSLHNISIAQDVVRIAVSAAEQMGAASGFDGNHKLALALDFAHNFAARHGVKLSSPEWHNLIEAEVAKLKTFNEELTAPAVPDAPPAPVGPSASDIAIAALKATIDQLTAPVAAPADVAGTAAV